MGSKERQKMLKAIECYKETIKLVEAGEFHRVGTYLSFLKFWIGFIEEYFNPLMRAQIEFFEEMGLSNAVIGNKEMINLLDRLKKDINTMEKLINE